MTRRDLYIAATLIAFCAIAIVGMVLFGPDSRGHVG